MIDWTLLISNCNSSSRTDKTFNQSSNSQCISVIAVRFWKPLSKLSSLIKSVSLLEVVDEIRDLNYKLGSSGTP